MDRQWARRAGRVVALLLAAGLVTAGCGDDAEADADASPAATSNGAVEGEIVVFAAASLTNAFQAMADGGTLSISVKKMLKSPYVRRSGGRRATDRAQPVQPAPPIEVVEIAVRDTGDGIPRETLDRIFDPFFTTRREGTGLGLSISQSIIHEHAGFISISSAVNVGTIVSIYLPLEKRHGQRRRR